MKKRDPPEILDTEECSFDIDEESVAYEGSIQSNLKCMKMRNIPKGQEP